MEDSNKYFDLLDLKGEFQLGFLDNRHLLIQFRNPDDYLGFYSCLVYMFMVI